MTLIPILLFPKSFQKFYLINIPTIAHEGQNAITNEEKANALAHNFAKVSSDIKYDDDFKEIKMHEENKLTFHDPNNDSVLNEPFNIAELNTAIDKSKCTTPGKDEISNNIIKQHSPQN